jgi:uncharacterized membrane protein
VNRNSLAKASALVVVTMLGVAYAAGSAVPADLSLPIHWGLDGQPDRYSDKWTALSLPAFATAAVSLLFYFLPSLEPRKQGLERSQGLYLRGWASLLIMGAFLQLAVLSPALGWELPADRLVVGGMGLMLVMIGNQLGKSRSMYLVGIRTPWTLASEEVWIKTHRLGGKLMVSAGLLMAVAALLPIPSRLLMALTAGAIAVSAIVPVVYSFLLWRREAGNGQPSE